MRQIAAIAIISLVFGIGLSAPAPASALDSEIAWSATLKIGDGRSTTGTATLAIFPNAPNVADSAEGMILATTRSGADGRVRIDLPDTALLRQLRQKNGGWIHANVVVRSPARARSFASFSLGRIDSAWIVRDGSGQRLAAKSLYATMTLPTVTAEPQSQGSARGCQYVVDDTWSQSTRILNFHSASNGNGQWHYGATADSDIDTAAAPYGRGWSVTGSVHVGSSSGAQVGGHTGRTYNAYTRTGFEYRKGHIRDYFGAPPGSQCTNSALVVGDQFQTVDAWNGGVADDDGPGSEARSCFTAPTSSYRNYYRPGTYLYKTNTRARRISFVIDLGFVRLGATSGYSLYVTMRWDSLRNRGIYLCGLSGYPTQSPGVVYAQNA